MNPQPQRTALGILLLILSLPVFICAAFFAVIGVVIGWPFIFYFRGVARIFPQPLTQLQYRVLLVPNFILFSATSVTSLLAVSGPSTNLGSDALLLVYVLALVHQILITTAGNILFARVQAPYASWARVHGRMLLLYLIPLALSLVILTSK